MLPFWITKKKKLLRQHTGEGLIPANTHINRKPLSSQKVFFLRTMGFKDVSSYSSKQLLRNPTISNSLGVALASTVESLSEIAWEAQKH